MKKLFFLLVVVNLVIWLWGQREQIARVIDQSPPALGTLRLLDEAAVAARRELAAHPAAPVVPATDTARRDEPAVAAEPGVAAPPVAESSLADAAAAPAAAAPPVVATPPVAAAPADFVPWGAETSAPPSPAPIEEHPVPPAPPPQDAAPSAAEPVAVSDGAVAMAPPVLDPAEPPDPGVPTARTEPVAADALADALPTAQEPSVSGPAVEEPVVAEPSVPEPPTTADATVTTDDRAPPTPPPVAVVETEVAPAAPQAAPAAPREVEYLCESIGPFAERPAAARVQSGIQSPLRRATIREERSPRAVRQWVLAPVQPSKEATAEYLTNLGRAGVKDAWRIPNGPLAGRLAVGVFQSAENAHKHADMLASRGVAAEVVAPKDLEPVRVYWVDYERPADAAPPNPGPAPRKVVPRACARVAGPGTLP